MTKKKKRKEKPLISLIFKKEEESNIGNEKQAGLKDTVNFNIQNFMPKVFKT